MEEEEERRKKQKHEEMEEKEEEKEQKHVKMEEKEEEKEEEETKKNHFVLVHGPCHGGWVWYKLATMLKSAGHRVTALDLAGCGRNPSRLEDIHSFNDYARPLMDAMTSIPPEEKVIVVGHCYGGFALSLAMERFPAKISVAVFLTGLMPKHWSPPASTLDEFFQRDNIESLMDCLFSFDQGLDNPLTAYTYGPEFMAKNMYQLCSAEDVTLGRLLVRPSDLYLEDISNETMLSEENYGSVNRVYIVSKQDKLYTEDFQRWVIQNNPPKEVKEIEGSDHMVMLSNPQELCHCLHEIAEKYA